MCMSGKPSRNKGARVEREFVVKLRASGINAKRVPLSGAAEGFKGDIIIETPCAQYRVEVKARKDGAGFRTLESWLDENDFLFLKRNNGDPLVTMSWDAFTSLIEESRTYAGQEGAEGE